MDSSKGYRLRARGVAELASFLDAWRAAALKILARRYGTLVAARAALAVDAARLGAAPVQDDPIRQACAAVRSGLSAAHGPVKWPEVNCVVAFHFVGDAVLARIVHGGDDYASAFSAMRGAVRWGWKPGIEKPARVSREDWDARRRYWEAAARKPGLGSSLTFTLVERPLPDLTWEAAARWMPGIEERARAAARVWKDSGRAPPREARDMERLVALAASRLDREPGRRPGAGAAGPTAPPGARLRREAETRRRQAAKDGAHAPPAAGDGRADEIDHADVVVAADGRVFMAVPYAGLDERARVFVQVGDSHVVIVQSGRQYGYVAGVQKSALDVLRGCRTVTLVEVAGEGAGRLLRARHVAIVGDIGLRESVAAPARRPGRPGGQGREIAEWDR